MITFPIRTALIGTGGIAGSHVAALQQASDRVNFVAAVDIVPEKVADFCSKHGVPGSYTDVASMLERERPQLVHIATPPVNHCDLAVQCLEAGAWVLCEKPLVASLAEMDRIEAAEARTGNYCSSVFQWRFGSGGQHFKALIANGELGRPLVATSLVTWWRSDAYYAVPWRGKWATEAGGSTMGHGIHPIDFLLWLMGDWQEVRAMMGTLNHNIEVEDVSMASVRFANGAMANLTNSVNSPREESYMRFDFQRATVELTHLYRYTNENWRYSLGPDSPYQAELTRWAALPSEVPSSHGTQLSSFLDHMGRGERPPVSGPDVRPTIEFLASLYKSAISGQPVLRGTIQPGDPFYTRMNGATPS